jgi:hypothetical protein
MYFYKILPAESLCTSNRKPSSMSGSQAHGIGLDLNLWPRKCTWKLKWELTCPGIGSEFSICSRKAFPFLMCKYKYLLVGSIFAAKEITTGYI